MEGAGDVSDFQKLLMHDGEVSLGEMNLAVAAYAECLSGLGISTEAEYSEGNGSFVYEFSSQSADVALMLDGPEGQECKALYIDDVELVFADEMGPTPEEDAQFYEGIAQCLRDAGFDVEASDPSTLSMWWQREPSTYQGCFDSAR